MADEALEPGRIETWMQILGCSREEAELTAESFSGYYDDTGDASRSPDEYPTDPSQPRRLDDDESVSETSILPS